MGLFGNTETTPLAPTITEQLLPTSYENRTLLVSPVQNS